MLIQLPFQGFYYSIHIDNIEQAIDNQIFTDYATGFTNNNNLSARLYDSLNWREVYLSYAKEYAEQFAHEHKIQLEFDSLSSPREYNFTTDRIFCNISESEARRLLDEVDGLAFKRIAKDMFTSRDGFNSFYYPDTSTWGDITEFDHNQLNCLLTAWLETNARDDWELYLMEDSFGNGFLNELLYQQCGDKRIYTVFDYLQTRLQRA